MRDLRDDNGTHEPNIERSSPRDHNRCSVSPPLFSRPGIHARTNGRFSDRALELPAADGDYFTDDTGSIFEDQINRLATAGITGGCSAGIFCPNDTITREQMAAFLVRAYNYSAPGTDRFTDDEASQFEAEINLLAEAGITTGCAVDRFCPMNPVLRDQMATFLARAELLEPIVVPAGCSILPADNIWNTRVDNLSVHSRSTPTLLARTSTTMSPDFGSGMAPFHHTTDP